MIVFLGLDLYLDFFLRKYLVNEKKRYWGFYSYGGAVPSPFAIWCRYEDGLRCFNAEGRKRYPALKRISDVIFWLVVGYAVLWFVYLLKTT